MIKKILFVCTGNTCRSTMAEGLFKKLLDNANCNDIIVESRGFAGSASHKVPKIILSLMEKEGCNMSKHISRPINKDDIDKADLILVMEVHHKNMFKKFYPEAIKKTFLLKEYIGEYESPEIFDPIGQSDEVYVATMNEIKNTLAKLLKRIEQENK